VAFFRGKSSPCFRFADGDSAHAAELVLSAIAVSTNAADGRGGIVGEDRCRVIRSLLYVRFHRQTLRGLQRRGQSIWTGLGTADFGLQTAVEVFQFRTGFLRVRR
jgi:hypothetical protein